MMEHFLLSIFLLSLVACSEQAVPAVGQYEDHWVPPGNNITKKARERRKIIPSTKPIQKLQTQRLNDAKSKPTQTPSSSVKVATQTISPALNSSTTSQPTDLIVPLFGREAVWSINPNKYISRDIIDCPKNRIDSFCMGLDYKVIQKIFGPPTQATHYTWSYNNMKVKYLAGGGRHSNVHIGFLDGKVCRVTTTR